MNNLPNKVPLLCLLLAISTFATHAQSPFVVTTDRADKTYNVNQWMAFDVVADITDSANYEIRFDRYAAPIQQGKIALQAGKTTKIYFKAEEPCALICTVSNNQFSDVEGAVFEPLNITPLEEEPNDFDAFWQESLAELARIPIDPKLSFYEATNYSTTYRLNLGMIDGRRVYGFLSVPKLEGKMPAVVSLPSFGAGPSIVRPVNDIAENIGALALAISIHNAEPDAVDANAYEPDNLTHPKEYYQRYAVLAAIRAIDYFFTRSDFNGSVGLTGVSQGGGLVIMVAGVDKRVAAITFGNPTHSEHSGLRHERATGFPYYFVRAKTAYRDENILQKVAASSKYYDNIYFAKRYKNPAFGVLGYEDQVCPTATSFASFNQLSEKKILLSATKLAHSNPGEYWSLRYDFFRRFLVGADRSPLPYVQAHKGYEIDAGKDTTIHINKPLILNGVAMLRNQTLTQHIQWKKLSGAGEVHFANANALNTNVTFSATGEYTLVLEVRDETLLGTDKFYTLLDRVTITVQPASQDLTLNCPAGSIRVVTREVVAQVNWQTPSVSNACNSQA
ncbi:MAG: acetylxylan esterase [Saprospiraceae bacterium]|nr:acetylxylan esterase [Saprospiraceae bacterium]